MTKIKNYFLLLAAIGFLFITACKKNPNEERWDTNILAPLVNSTLTLKNLINDTLMKTNSAGEVSLVYRSGLYDFSIDSLFKIPDTTMTNSYGLTSLNIANQNVVYKLSLGQMLIQGGLGTFAGLDSTYQVIPPIPQGQITTTYPINVDTIFQSMTLIDGQMVISIQNQFPIAIYSVHFLLKNTSNQAIIVDHTFDSIPAHSTRSFTGSLAGKTVNGAMTASIDGIWSPGSNGNLVYIDTTNQLITTLSVINLVPDSATAKFPGQDLIKKTTVIPMNLKGVQLTKIIAQSGNVVIDAYNTLPDTLRFQYVIPGARLNGVIFKAIENMPPSVNHVASHVHKEYKLDGYTIDLKGPHEDTVNTYYFNIIGTIDSTGQIQTLTRNDSIKLTTSFTGLVPYYAKGYLGQQMFELGPGSVPVDLFKNIIGDSIRLANVIMNLSVQNGIGANARLVIDTIEAENSRTKGKGFLKGKNNTNLPPFAIARATETGNSMNPVNIAYSSLHLDSSNSTAPLMLSVMPTQLDYKLRLFLDTAGNSSNFNDFIYYGNGLKANVDFEIPMNFMCYQLMLIDTTAFNIGNTKQSGKIKSGTFTLNVGNGFPLGGTIQMFLLDQYGNQADSLFATNTFVAAPLGTDSIVHAPKYSALSMPISEAKMQNVLKATKAIIKIKFSTQPAGTKVKIYSDYNIALKLVGNFVYKVE